MTGLPLNIDFQQVLFHLLNFVILFAIIYFLLYKPVKKFMNNRKSEYEKMDADANNKLEEAEKLKTQYQEKISRAEEEIRIMTAEASKDIAEKSASLEQEAKKHAAEIIEKAKSDALVEQSKILNKTGEQVTEIAKEAAKKMVFESTSDAFDCFLNAAEGKINE